MQTSWRLTRPVKFTPQEAECVQPLGRNRPPPVSSLSLGVTLSPWVARASAPSGPRPRPQPQGQRTGSPRSRTASRPRHVLSKSAPGHVISKNRNNRDVFTGKKKKKKNLRAVRGSLYPRRTTVTAPSKARGHGWGAVGAERESAPRSTAPTAITPSDPTRLPLTNPSLSKRGPRGQRR